MFFVKYYKLFSIVKQFFLYKTDHIRYIQYKEEIHIYVFTYIICFLCFKIRIRIRYLGQHLFELVEYIYNIKNKKQIYNSFFCLVFWL